MSDFPPPRGLPPTRGLPPSGPPEVRQRKQNHWQGWSNVQEDCLLCEMEKRTKWYLETDWFVVAEKLQGGPFIVSKRHTKELTDEEWQAAERTVEEVFDEPFDLQVLMNLVKEHWHAHIVKKGTTVDLSGE